MVLSKGVTLSEEVCNKARRGIASEAKARFIFPSITFLLFWRSLPFRKRHVFDDREARLPSEVMGQKVPPPSAAAQSFLCCRSPSRRSPSRSHPRAVPGSAFSHLDPCFVIPLSSPLLSSLPLFPPQTLTGLAVSPFACPSIHQPCPPATQPHNQLIQ